MKRKTRNVEMTYTTLTSVGCYFALLIIKNTYLTYVKAETILYFVGSSSMWTGPVLPGRAVLIGVFHINYT